MKTIRLPLLIPLCVAATTAALAQESSTDQDVQTVVVTGRYEFLSVDTSGATNLPVAIEKLPQSISLVSADFIKAADLKSLSDIAEYTPGAQNAGNQEGFASLISLRGFNSGQSIDGLNVGDLPMYEPDYAIVDRLEIVKGPSSVVYGVSSPGGLVNFVTKSARPDTKDYLSFEGGMWNSYRAEGQIAGALDSTGTTRGIAVVVRDQGDSFMHEVDHHSTVLYGGVDTSFGDSVTTYLHGGYEKHGRTSFDGIPTLEDGTPAPLPRSYFIGSPNYNLHTTAYHAETDTTWHASSSLEFSLKGNYRRSRTHGVQPYSFELQPNGDIGLAIESTDPETLRDYGIGLSSLYRLEAVGLKDSFVTVAALYQNTRDSYAGRQGIFDGEFTGTANVFDGEEAVTRAIEAAVLSGGEFGYSGDTTSKTLTYSAQAILQMVEHLSVLLGASSSKPDITSTSDGVTQDFSAGRRESYRAGLTYEFLPGTNAYVSFSESFRPQLSIDINNNVLPPLTGVQYETGVKYRTPNGRMLVSGALFRINQKNEAQFDTQVDGFDRYRAVGEVQHKGFELSALGQINRQWQINAGYAFLDAKVKDDLDTSTIGKRRLFLPKQSASIFSSYTFTQGMLPGFSLGAGVRYVGSQRTSFDGSTGNLRSYTLADVTLGYENGPWSFQLNGHNVFDKHYYVNNYQTLFYGNVVGTPANVALSVQRTF